VEAGFAAVYGYEYLLEHGVIMGVVVYNVGPMRFWSSYVRYLFAFCHVWRCVLGCFGAGFGFGGVIMAGVVDPPSPPLISSLLVWGCVCHRVDDC